MKKLLIIILLALTPLIWLGCEEEEGIESDDVDAAEMQRIEEQLQQEKEQYKSYEQTVDQLTEEN
jgi:outer membrane lipoprotein-sorting protein